MNVSLINNIEMDLCKSHSARSEPTRVYKMNKAELEDQYLKIMQDNIILKQTVNNQTEQIKLLSTKLQRITNLHKTYSRQRNSCCVNLKLAIEEQNFLISNLKQENERLIEKVRTQNVRLCSMKQFRSTLKLSTSRSQKNISSSIALASQVSRSETNLLKASVSCQCDENYFGSGNVHLGEDNRLIDHQNVCNDNKCKARIEELESHIAELEKELSSKVNESNTKLKHLEAECSRLQNENSLLRARRMTDESNLKAVRAQLLDISTSYEKVFSQLTVERKRVLELEMQVKSTRMSSQLSKTIEDCLNKAEKKTENFLQKPVLTPTKSITCNFQHAHNSTPIAHNLSIPKNVSSILDNPGTSDDSGYNDPNRIHEDLELKQNLTKINRDLIKKVSDLQTELDLLKLNQFISNDFKTSNANKSKDIVAEETIAEALNTENIESQHSIEENLLLENDSHNSSHTSIVINKNNNEKMDINDDKNDVHSAKAHETTHDEREVHTSESQHVVKLTAKKHKKARSKDKILKSEVNKKLLDEADRVKMSQHPPKTRSDSSSCSTEKRSDIARQTFTISKDNNLSSDETDYDVPSLEESPRKFNYGRNRLVPLSPGEMRLASPSTSTPSYSNDKLLSEGEVPIERNLSIGEKIITRRQSQEQVKISSQSTKECMEETLKAVSIEMERCKRLLRLGSHEIVRSK